MARYDLNARQWLAPFSVSGGGTALAVGASGIFAGFGRRIARLELGGGPEQQLLNTAGDVMNLALAEPLVASLGDEQGLLSIDATTGAILDVTTNLYAYYGLDGLSAAPSMHRVFGRSLGLSPSDIVMETLAADDTFELETDSPYHGGFPDASRTFVFPDETRVADDAGIVYTTSALEYAGSLGGRLDDVAFDGDLPIVLRETRLFSYDAAYREQGRSDLPESAARIFVHDGTIFAFRATDAGDVAVREVPVTNLTTPPPGPVVDPDGLAYAFDGFARGVDGAVYVLSNASANVFRWRPSTRTYGPSIPLRDVPSHMAYSAVTNRLYVAYPSGSITQIQLDVSDAEEPFATAPQPPCGLATAGELVFACVPVGAWLSHFTWTPDGTLVSQVEWNYFSREYVWSPELRKMFFFRDDSSPNDILWEDIDVGGHIGAMLDSPYHGDFLFEHPIRLGPASTTVLTGAGLFFDPVTLVHTGSLANEIDDAVWIDDGLLTIRHVAPPPDVFTTGEPGWGVSEVQAWGPGNHPLLWRRLLPGFPRRLFADGTTPIAVTSAGGVPQWLPLTCGNGVVDAYEACDGPQLGGASCSSLGLGTGVLACTGGCELDASGCSVAPSCGDGVIDQSTELCDGSDLGAAPAFTCQSLGFTGGGTLACRADCSGFDTSECASCGNGVIDADRNEQCDGNDLGFATCESQGYRGGVLGCTAACTFDLDGCQRDCATQPCEPDDDPCTVDGCSDTGCTHDAIDACTTLSGYGVLRVSATVHRGGLTGDCAGRCGNRIRSALVLLEGDTYRIPTEQPTSCPSERVVIPDELGTVHPGRRGRDLLVASNLADVIAAAARCGGYKAKIGQAKSWIRRAGGAVVEGRSVLVTRERRNDTTFRVRRSTRLGGPSQVVTPPHGFDRLQSCAETLRLRCVVR